MVRHRKNNLACALQLIHYPVAVKPPPNLNFAQQPMASILKANLPQPAPRPTPAALPRYAAVAAAAVTPQPAAQASSSQLISTVAPSNPPPVPAATPSMQSSFTLQASTDQVSAAASSPSLTQLSVTSPMLSSSASQQHEGSFYSGEDSPVPQEAITTIKPNVTSSPQRAAQKGKVAADRVSKLIDLHRTGIFTAGCTTVAPCSGRLFEY